MANLFEVIAGTAPVQMRVDFSNTSGNVGSIPLFTVTGIVAVKLYALCEVDLAGASATLEIGTATNTAGLIAQTTATSIDANEIWQDNSPDASVELSSTVAEHLVSQNIIATVGTAPITSGRLRFGVTWYPVTANGSLVPVNDTSASPSMSPSSSASPSSSVSPSSSASSSASPSLSPSSSASPSASASRSQSPSSSTSASLSPSSSASSSVSASLSPSASASRSQSPSSSASASLSPSASASPSLSPSSSVSPSMSPSPL